MGIYSSRRSGGGETEVNLRLCRRMPGTLFTLLVNKAAVLTQGTPGTSYCYLIDKYVCS